MKKHCSILLTSMALAFALVPGWAFGQSSVSELKKMSLEELSAQEVTSVSKTPEPYSGAPAAIQVITHDDIRRSGATTLPEVLRLADNLMVAQKGAHAWAITARGFNTDLANKLLVLIDGRTVYTPLFSGVFWDRQDYLLDDIDRIEVISGPGGTLWGANAVNGVINIVTKSAARSQGLFAEGGGGTDAKGLAGVRYGGMLTSGTAFRTYAKYADHDGELLSNGTDAADSWRLGQGGFRIDTDASRKNALTFQGDYYDGREQLATSGTGDVSGGNVLGRWSRTASTESDFSLQFYYDRTHLTIPVPAQAINGVTIAGAGTLSDDLDTLDLDFHHRFPLFGRQHVTWGLGYRFTRDDVANAPGLAFVPPLLKQNLSSGFVQDEVSLSQALAVTLGTKVEHNDYTGVEAEPSARLRWTVTPQHLVWAAVSRAVRAPARVDRDERLPTPALSALGVNNLLVGGADFASETVVTYELGTRAQIGHMASISASTFYNRYDDLRSTSLSPADPVFHLPFPLFFANNLEGETYGIELSATLQPREWWQLHTGYSYLHESIWVKHGQFDFNNALNETADPKHRVSLRSSMNIGHKVDVDAAFRWVDAFQYNVSGAPGAVPDYGELTGRLGWSPAEHLELSITGQNLLHDQHLEYVISPPNPREEIGRHVTMKAAIRW